MTEYHVKRDLNFPKPPPVELNQIAWVNMWGKDEFMVVPMRVIRVYPDGTWDGELMEGEA